MRIRMIEPVQSKTPEKKRVCAYARVSTDSRKQGESLENQITSYERSIKSNPEYEFVGVFADKGISGFSQNRPEFQRMVQMARDGKVDLIITKSISRFARNTAVFLEVVRELRQIALPCILKNRISIRYPGTARSCSLSSLHLRRKKAGTCQRTGNGQSRRSLSEEST